MYRGMNRNVMLNAIRKGTITAFFFKPDLLPYSVNGLVEIEHLLLREHFKLCLSFYSFIFYFHFLKILVPSISKTYSKPTSSLLHSQLRNHSGGMKPGANTFYICARLFNSLRSTTSLFCSTLSNVLQHY